MSARTIGLSENVPRSLSRESLSANEGELIWRHYGSQVTVEFPSPRTDGRWQLTANGWAGFLPVTPDLSLILEPKVPIANLFGMLEYAYRHQIDFLAGMFECASIRELYERLAVMLSRRILDRGRRGYYREYVARRARLPYLRGRLDVPRQATVPWATTLPCRFEERTADIDDNRILAWTLRTILAGRFCEARGTVLVRRALQELRLVATEIPYAGAACKNRIYHRLNDDYRPMHALCRFFLDLCGPTQNVGGRTMIPFMVEMPHLFEKFIAEWTRKELSSHVLPRYRASIQETVPIGLEGNLRFDIDLVVYEVHPGTPVMVIDTKYKRPGTPSQADIFQVVTYATAKQCHDAVLVYPSPLVSPLDVQIGSIRVRSAVFPLAGGLEEGGRTFMNQLDLP